LVPGEDILIADRPTDFAKAILGLLTDPTRAAELAGQVRKRMEEEFSWRTVAERYIELFEGVFKPPTTHVQIP